MGRFQDEDEAFPTWCNPGGLKKKSLKSENLIDKVTENQLKFIKTIKEHVKDKNISDEDFRKFIENAINCKIL